MKRYTVKFAEIRHYEMIVDAYDEAAAIRKVRCGPEHPKWTYVELGNWRAEQIAGKAS